ncbi:MAG: asparagine synthase (glutamine-hydrolyzing) [Deltaproteobacteria bacterium]|nr:asparagine synthase (glutamine-hydrolyzing) [Deltaproteobacteria bacterium]MBP2685184.1 asparagine synthase (glutamine-hydrolyzing) [Deltaproteobacteria bacterium]
MCGIYGEVSFRPGGVGRELLHGATEIVRHRGPDGYGYIGWHPDESRAVPCREAREIPGVPLVAFGHRRLSIIDLSEAASQPMGTPEGDLWITYNGEVYNYLELRVELAAKGHVFRTASDTEIILHAYREWGEECLSRFNGMWAFGLLDLRKNRLFCARDRMGVKPFYYHCDGRRFLFGSEIKQLLVDPSISRESHAGAAYDYLVHGVLDHSDRTLFRSIRQLRGGCFLTVDLSGDSTAPSIRRYWGIDPGTRVDGLTDAQYAERFRELLEDSVRHRLRSDVPVGSCLSGGLDSSSIVCIANRLLRREGEAGKQNTFSSCFEDRRFDERIFIDTVVAATAVTTHCVFPREGDMFRDLPSLSWHQDEPFGSSSIYAQWCVFRLARENGVKVMLDGQGADELLGGYHGFFDPYLAGLLASGKIAAAIREMAALRRIHRYGAANLAKRLLAGILGPDSLPVRFGSRLLGTSTRDVLDPGFLAEGRTDSLLPEIPRIRGRSQLWSALHESCFHTSLPALLHYEDRNSMAHSLESRVPFLDYRLVEYLFSIPDDQKIRAAVTKVILRNAMRGILPEEVRGRMDKMGFVTPEEEWLKGEPGNGWASRLEKAPSGVFHVPRALRRLEEMRAGRVPFGFAPWRWISFAAWWHANAGGGR